jgi:hypothetical protein
MAKSSSRATVGDNVFSYVGNGTPQRSSYHTTSTRTEVGKGAAASKTAVPRGSHKMTESNGAKYCVTGVLYKANASQAGEQTRNVRLMPSATGVTDFRKARSMTGQVI